MHYSTINYCDTVNGEGIRVSLFVSGCSNRCPGCFNPEAWDPNFGEPFTNEQVEKILDTIEQRDLDGLSLLGGDPLEPCNCEAVLALVNAFRARFGFRKTIWLWSGYTLEQIVNNLPQWEIAKQVDVMIEGPFVLAQKDLTLAFRGSTNQQIIDMQASQAANSLILKEEYM